MFQKTLPFLLILVSPFWLSAQNSHRLTAKHNRLRSGDEIIKQQVEYKDPGPQGRNIIWDFSNLHITNEKYKVSYISRTKGDTVHISALEHNTCYRYTLNNDTLWLNNFENRTTKLNLEQPEATMTYPFNYGDSLVSKFKGRGLYCEKVNVIADGLTTVVADGTGIIITPERDTIGNVTRVHQIRQYNQIGLDSASLKLETYRWYGYGYRYPVFETVISTIQKGDSVVQNFATSFYYPPSEIRSQLSDAANEEAKYAGGNAIAQVFTEGHFWPNPVASELQIDYKLTQKAQVWFSLHSSTGLPLRTTTPITQSEGDHATSINMTSVMTGTYALYIHVDDMVMRQVVIKK